MSVAADNRRLAYLQAIGVQAWRAHVRRPAIAPEPVTDAVAAKVAASDDAEVASAALPGNWVQLREQVQSCTRCALHAGRKQTVFGVGNQGADWLIVGEAPGAEEDRQGEPFVGRAGQLLNAMLGAIGLTRETVYIANILKCRPPGNRDPKPAEVASCTPYLDAQILLLRPRIILAVGRIAAQHLLRTDAPLARLRGRVHHYGTAATALVVTYHPAYLLRSPADKRKAWEDLKFARSTLAALQPVKSHGG
ncbi:MAG: uracil-DNA glycosylase [Steroidobacteraceae bacterium]